MIILGCFGGTTISGNTHMLVPKRVSWQIMEVLWHPPMAGNLHSQWDQMVGTRWNELHPEKIKGKYVLFISRHCSFDSIKQLCEGKNGLNLECAYPIPSMDGLFTYIWLFSMVNGGKYTVRPMDGIGSIKPAELSDFHWHAKRSLAEDHETLAKFPIPSLAMARLTQVLKCLDRVVVQKKNIKNFRLYCKCISYSEIIVIHCTIKKYNIIWSITLYQTKSVSYHHY